MFSIYDEFVDYGVAKKDIWDHDHSSFLLSPLKKKVRSKEEKLRQKRHRESRCNLWYSNSYKGVFICYWCKGSFKKKDFTRDHLVPKSQGGISCKKNLVASCGDCNNYRTNHFKKFVYRLIDASLSLELMEYYDRLECGEKVPTIYLPWTDRKLVRKAK